MKLAILFSAVFSIHAFAEGVLTFSPEVYNLGEVKQGETRHIVLSGKNSSQSEVLLENVMSQGIGGENFKFPKKIAPQESFKIEFDLKTEYLEGPVTNNIILVSPNGDVSSTAVEGFVSPEVLFSEKILDAGYYAKGEAREWSFYVWSPNQKERPRLKLSKESAAEFSATFQDVSLKTEKLDEIAEGGKTPGLKVTLKTTGLKQDDAFKNQKSLRKIVGFESLKNKNARPEILIIGYWK